jgi:hypothetical protein
VSSAPGDGNAVDRSRDCRGRLGRRGLIGAIAVHLTAVCSDGGPTASHIAVAIRISSGIVGHSHGLHVHAVRPVGIVGHAASPIYNPG